MVSVDHFRAHLLNSFDENWPSPTMKRNHQEKTSSVKNRKTKTSQNADEESSELNESKTTVNWIEKSKRNKKNFHRQLIKEDVETIKMIK